jgi:Anti-repressor SinI
VFNIPACAIKHIFLETDKVSLKFYNLMTAILGGSINKMGTAYLDEKELDKEWLELILEARRLGIPYDEIRDFLKKAA